MSFKLNERTGVWETIKSPYAELDYSIDWTALHSDELSISTSTWSVDAGEGTAPVINPLTTAITGFVTTAMIAGGTLGNSYIIRNRITLASGLKDERIFKLIIKETSQ
jgi:hypothetical protein